jgi:hypothetical protein
MWIDIKLARDCIHNKRDFSIETTLAGGNVIRQIQDAKEFFTTKENNQTMRLFFFFCHTYPKRLNVNFLNDP